MPKAGRRVVVKSNGARGSIHEYARSSHAPQILVRLDSGEMVSVDRSDLMQEENADRETSR